MPKGAMYMPQATLKETADELGITEAAVKSRLHRARAFVRGQLDASLQLN